MKPRSPTLSRSQVALVLERAARLDSDGHEEGLTIAELRSVAQEAGIPSEALSRALADLASTAAQENESRWRLGRHTESGSVSGRISDDDLAWLLRILAQLGQIKGQVMYEPGVLRWTTPDRFNIELRSHPSGTYLRVEFDDGRHFALRAGLFSAAGGTSAAALFQLFQEASYPEILVPAVAGALLGGAASLAYWKARAAAVGERVRKRATALLEVLSMVKSRGGVEDD